MKDHIRKSDEELQAEQLIESLSRLDNDAQAVAILDMEKALAGVSQIALPNWLKGVPQGVIMQARHQMQRTVTTVRKTEGDDNN